MWIAVSSLHLFTHMNIKIIKICMYVNVVYSILGNTSFKIINSLYIFPILFYIYLRDSEVVNEEKKNTWNGIYLFSYKVIKIYFMHVIFKLLFTNFGFFILFYFFHILPFTAHRCMINVQLWFERNKKRTFNGSCW